LRPCELKGLQVPGAGLLFFLERLLELSGIRA
jgi:hypothetical protein